MRSVLVTGASTGIGRATALRLDAAGWRVFAGFRDPADGESLRAEGSDRIAPVQLDVTEPEQVAAAAARVEEESDGGLHGLVNNAGVAIPGRRWRRFPSTTSAASSRSISSPTWR
jgi:NAD(P)-dependent dehydrogenase (short-subunit alcohol dehydrogenase family)